MMETRRDARTAGPLPTLAASRTRRQGTSVGKRRQGSLADLMDAEEEKCGQGGYRRKTLPPADPDWQGPSPPRSAKRRQKVKRRPRRDPLEEALAERLALELKAEAAGLGPVLPPAKRPRLAARPRLQRTMAGLPAEDERPPGRTGDAVKTEPDTAGPEAELPADAVHTATATQPDPLQCGEEPDDAESTAAGRDTAQSDPASTEAADPATEPETGSAAAGRQTAEAGLGSAQAGSGPAEAGSGPAEAGSGPAEAGSGSAEASSGSGEAVAGSAEAGSGPAEATAAAVDPGSVLFEEADDAEGRMAASMILPQANRRIPMIRRMGQLLYKNRLVQEAGVEYRELLSAAGEQQQQEGQGDGNGTEPAGGQPSDTGPPGCGRPLLVLRPQPPSADLTVLLQEQRLSARDGMLAPTSMLQALDMIHALRLQNLRLQAQVLRTGSERLRRPAGGEPEYGQPPPKKRGRRGPEKRLATVTTERLARLERIETGVERIFTPVQIGTLCCEEKRKFRHWSEEDLRRAIELRAICSRSVFNYVRGTIGVPLPCINTLKLRCPRYPHLQAALERALSEPAPRCPTCRRVRDDARDDAKNEGSRPTISNGKRRTGTKKAVAKGKKVETETRKMSWTPSAVELPSDAAEQHKEEEPGPASVAENEYSSDDSSTSSSETDSSSGDGDAGEAKDEDEVEECPAITKIRKKWQKRGMWMS